MTRFFFQSSLESIFFVFLCLFLLSNPAQAGFKEGLDAYKRQDYKTAFEEWQSLAEQGNSSAQNNLGFMYRKGLGVEIDFSKGKAWYQRSAEQGNVLGQYNLGLMTKRTSVTISEIKEAIRWLKLAANQDHAKSQLALGEIYYQGDIVGKDYIQAYFWFQLAAPSLHKARQLRSKITQEMSSRDIQTAKKFIAEWKETYRE